MRFYISPEFIGPSEKTITIMDKQEIHHIKDVMRLKEDNEVTLFDGKGNEYLSKIIKVSSGSIELNILKKTKSNQNAEYLVTLYQAIPKKTNLEFITEKAVELGVSKIVPIVTERCIARDMSNNKIERLNRIAKAASKQCGRLEIPVISDAIGFRSAVSRAEKDTLVIFAALNRENQPLKHVLQKERVKDISIFVGPEGDFSPQEASLAKASGFKISSLGELVLKVETAGIYILSCISYEYSQ